ncbi:hypothetical protein NLU13_8601 [Sarocladium strictum]|uniref:Aminotransferase n=1 Tax=Sarocladium strictum TaxID=5046 RepID=A0AA39L5A9_SARSR|nr:hypothetical protein NLU13_8601 [Sarocladium strictum]
MPIKSIPGSCIGKDNEDHSKELSLLVITGLCTSVMRQRFHPVEQTRMLQVRGGISHLGKDGVFRTMSKDYNVIDAKGLTPDEIQQFLAILPYEVRNTDEAKELANVYGSKVTSYQGLFEPEEGILPKKPSEEEKRQRREALEKQRESADRDASSSCTLNSNTSLKVICRFVLYESPCVSHVTRGPAYDQPYQGSRPRVKPRKAAGVKDVDKALRDGLRLPSHCSVGGVAVELGTISGSIGNVSTPGSNLTSPVACDLKKLVIMMRNCCWSPAFGIFKIVTRCRRPDTRTQLRVFPFTPSFAPRLNRPRCRDLGVNIVFDRRQQRPDGECPNRMMGHGTRRESTICDKLQQGRMTPFRFPSCISPRLQCTDLQECCCVMSGRLRFVGLYCTTALDGIPLLGFTLPPELAVQRSHRWSIPPPPLNVVAARGTTVTFSNGKTIEDTSCGAAVACIGYDNERVKAAMMKQIDEFAYSNSMFYGHPIGEELAAELIRGTNGEMAKVYLMCSGAEAMEAAMKMARQYFMELSPKQPQRMNFIARQGSYHGSTLGSLSMSGHVARRKLFEGMLFNNIHRVSAAYEYRGKTDGQTTEEYVAQLAEELDQKFQEIGPDTVCAFVAESVVGATLGTVPAPAGYFKAVKKVCDKYGALLILDEVMSGMGRCGSLHEWEQEGVVPDIQTIAKGLAGGFAPMAGMFINHRVSDALITGTGVFSHAHTYQGHPVGCAAALEVQRIIREGNLIQNVHENGEYLGKLLQEQLGDHPYVGDVRGRGFFWSLEFVEDKKTKEPFPPSAGIAKKVHLAALDHVGISFYPGMGTKDGVAGDHAWIGPAYTSTKKDVERIVSKVKESVVLALG